MPKLKIYLADHFDPWFNLATENYLFHDMDPETFVLFLWRNEKTIVIGRNQNPWSECHVEAMEEDGIRLARRQSGGGAVYHDLGNTNFTFLSAKSGYDRNANSQIIINAAERLGLTLERNGRNDLVVPCEPPEQDGVTSKKVSGAAFKETPDRCFHHGTMLISADLSKLAKYLNPSKRKLQSKGTKSVRSRVGNLSDFLPDANHDDFCSAVMDSFRSFYQGDCEPEWLDTNSLTQIPEIHSYYQKQKDWEWRFGKSPSFQHLAEHRFDWGEVQVHMDFKKGKVEACQIYSDSLIPDVIDRVAQSLVGVDYRRESILAVGKEVCRDFSEHPAEVESFFSWLSSEV